MFYALFYWIKRSMEIVLTQNISCTVHTCNNSNFKCSNSTSVQIVFFCERVSFILRPTHTFYSLDVYNKGFPISFYKFNIFPREGFPSFFCAVIRKLRVSRIFLLSTIFAQSWYSQAKTKSWSHFWKYWVFHTRRKFGNFCNLRVWRSFYRMCLKLVLIFSETKRKNPRPSYLAERHSLYERTNDINDRGRTNERHTGSA